MTNQVYFERSFNQQMVDICFEVEEIIRSGAKETIKAMGRENYGSDTTKVIERLFELTLADPKNLGLSREILRAEADLKAYLYDAPGALPEKEILAYWRGYRDSLLAEAEQHAPYYFLMRGHEDWNHDNDRWIGIYRTISVLKDEFFRAKDKLEEEKSSAEIAFGKSCSKALSEERVMIHAFDEVDGKWYYDIKPETLFESKRGDFKEVTVLIDAFIMSEWRLFCTKKTFGGYWLYDDTLNKYRGGRRNGEESINVIFNVTKSYEILNYFHNCWGNFNCCPTIVQIRGVAETWNEKFGAEIVGISHDELAFRCRKQLTSKDADEIIAEAAALHAEITDCKPEKVKDYIVSKGEFTLWWD